MQVSRLGLLGTLAIASLCGCSSVEPSGGSGAGGAGAAGGNQPASGGGANVSGGASSGGRSSGGVSSGESNGGATGSASSGGATGDAGSGETGGTGGVQQPLSPYSACVEYVDAACTRIAECGGLPNGGCFIRKDECPDFLFSPGGTRTPESLRACAKEWATLPCGLAANGGAPPCATPGTRAMGESCYYSHQCASGLCKLPSGGDCGTCTASVSLGGDCGSSECDEGLACIDYKCAAPPDQEQLKRLSPMDACSIAKGATGICPARTQCLRVTTSAPYLCHPLPEAGQPCVVGYCADTAWCPPEAPRTCKALPGAGDPCIPLNALAIFRCKAGTFCGTGSLCAVQAQIGAICDINGLDSCAGDGVTCTGTTEFRCVKHGEEGEPCSEEYEWCVRGTTCTNGFCRPSGSQGIFESECRR